MCRDVQTVENGLENVSHMFTVTVCMLSVRISSNKLRQSCVTLLEQIFPVLSFVRERFRTNSML